MSATIKAATVVLDLQTSERVIEKFLKSHDVCEISRESYRRRLRHFTKWCETNKHINPTRIMILEYKRHLRAKKYTPLTQNAYLVAVRSFFSWAESEGIYPNIARSVKGSKKQKGFRRDPLTISQIHQLLSSVDRSTLKGKRDFALLNLMVRTGPRTIEIVRANVEDIRQQSGESVLWLQGKGAEDKDEFVVLTPSTLDPIMEYLSARGGPKADDALFGSTSDSNLHDRMTTRSIRRIVKDRLRGINLNSPRLSSHSLRHSMVTLGLMAGASIQEVQKLARHADLNTTMIYAHNISRAAGVPEKKIDELLEKV